LAAGTVRSVTVWQEGTWELLADLDLEYVHELAFGPGEAPLLAASNEVQTALWEAAGRPTETVRAPDRLIRTRGGSARLHFSPDGTLLATSTSTRVNLWTTVDGRHVRYFRKPDTWSNRGEFRFSPDGTRLAMAYGKWVEVHPV